MDDINKLKAENEELKKINESKSDLISITAHKLRTYLTALKWTLRMFLNKDLGDVSNEQKKYLDVLIENNEKSISLVNNILDSNNTNDNSTLLNIKSVNIIELLEKIISIFSGEIKNKKLNLVLNKNDDAPQVKCDEEMITAVFENLIENAIKYSHNNGSIILSIKRDTEEKRVLISIEDNGIGIKEEDTPKIFGKYFRAPNAIEKESNGSGLGLFATKSFVEKNKGSIWFESTKNGTTFFVRLPID